MLLGDQMSPFAAVLFLLFAVRFFALRAKKRTTDVNGMSLPTASKAVWRSQTLRKSTLPPVVGGKAAYHGRNEMRLGLPRHQIVEHIGGDAPPAVLGGEAVVVNCEAIQPTVDFAVHRAAALTAKGVDLVVDVELIDRSDGARVVPLRALRLVTRIA